MDGKRIIRPKPTPEVREYVSGNETAAAYLTALEQYTQLTEERLRLAEIDLEKCRHAADVDETTGLFSKRRFNDTLYSTFERVPFSLLYMDVDRFKSYNDTYGHNEGDKALKAVGDAILGSIRSHDVACKIGGEEIAIVAPETDLTTGKTVAERIRRRVESLEVDPEHLKRQVTVSIGIASYPYLIGGVDILAETTGDGVKIAVLKEWADQALYHAKESGRNRVSTMEDISDKLLKSRR